MADIYAPPVYYRKRWLNTALAQSLYMRKHPKSPLVNLFYADRPYLDALDVYRIEHSVTKLGPYYHGQQDGLNEAFRPTAAVMSDIEDIPVAQAILLKHPGSIFGFLNMSACIRFIKDASIMKELGFSIQIYKDVVPLYISGDDQVLFERGTYK